MTVETEIAIARRLLILSRQGHFELWIDGGQIRLASPEAPDVLHRISWSTAVRIVDRGWWTPATRSLRSIAVVRLRREQRQAASLLLHNRDSRSLKLWLTDTITEEILILDKGNTHK